MEILQSHRDQEVLKEYISKIAEPNCYVEIGTHEGGSALFASENTKRPVYSTDIINKLTFEPKFNFILGNSLDVAKTFDKPIGVLFIDGDHFQAGKDFEAWKDKVVKGGYILFHDYLEHTEWCVTTDCDNIMEKYKDEYEVIFKPNLPADNTSILILRKK